MPFDERLEQLVELHKMCLQELHLLRTNLEHYVETSSDVVTTISARWSDVKRGGLALNVYDNFLTSLTDVMNMSRKINLQLHPQSDDNISTFFYGNDSTNWAIRSNKEICAKSLDNLAKQITKVNIVDDDSRCLYPAEEISISKEAVSDVEFVYPKLNINDFYEIGSNIKAFVSYLKDADELTFYVFDFQSEFAAIIAEVAQSIDLHQYHNLPPAREIFGIVLDKRILRAVRTSQVFFDQEMDEEFWPCYLLDFGEVVNLKNSDIKYKLRDIHKKTPSLALLCQLKVPTSLNSPQERYRQMEYETCELKIVEMKKDTLVVELIEEDSTNTIVPSTAIEQKRPPVETNPFKTSYNEEDAYKLTDAELDMLYDEPLCTSNAMKAVMGHDPQDDKRICRFYDPEIGACFKGSNCKQDHVPFHPDGWTKDVLPAVSIIDNRSPVVVYSKGDIINITPTYIGQLGSFYAQMTDSQYNSSPLIWNDEDVPAWKRLEKPPHIFELVLCRYEDELWYRAKILAHDDDYKMFKVFYVDYGNHQIVHLRNLSKCDHSMAQIPFQASLCRLAGVRDADVSAEKKKTGIQMLCNMILNEPVDAKVVSHHEDLIVSFVSEKHRKITSMLIDEGYMVPYKL